MQAWRPSRSRPSFVARQLRQASRWVAGLVWLGAVTALFALRGFGPAPDVSGLADSPRAAVVAPASGRVATVLAQLHQFVDADAVVARLDDRDVRLRLREATAELEALRADMVRVQADLEREAKGTANALELEGAVEQRRLVSAVEAASLAALATRTDLEEARVRLQGAAIEAERTVALAAQQILAEPDVVRARTERDALQKRVDELGTLLEEHKARVATAKARLQEFTLGKPIDVPIDTALAPLRWQLQQKEAELERIALDAQSLDLRAPIAGHVAAIAIAPGTWAVAGATVLTIVDPVPRRVLAYVPDAQRQRLATARRIELHRADATPLGATSIVSISPTAVRLPPRLWRDPQREEWGCEIVLAATGAEMPGELLRVAARD
jgi:multidrug resistance efflux pump